MAAQQRRGQQQNATPSNDTHNNCSRTTLCIHRICMWNRKEKAILDKNRKMKIHKQQNISGVRGKARERERDGKRRNRERERKK